MSRSKVRPDISMFMGDGPEPHGGIIGRKSLLLAFGGFEYGGANPQSSHLLLAS